MEEAEMKLEAVRAQMAAQNERVKFLQQNISVEDDSKNSSWRASYNKQLVDQRVKEELERKQRFEELERRVTQQEHEKRKQWLQERLAKVNQFYEFTSQKRKFGPQYKRQVFIPFGNPLAQMNIKSQNILLISCSAGFVGVWKCPSASLDSPSSMPALVDAVSILSRDSAGGGNDVTTTSCFLNRLVLHTDPSANNVSLIRSCAPTNDSEAVLDTVIMFSILSNGKWCISQIRLDMNKEKSDKLAMYDTHPSKAINSMDMSMDKSPERWILKEDILIERSAKGMNVNQSVMFDHLEAGITILTISDDAIMGWDLNLTNLWTCELSEVFPLISQTVQYQYNVWSLNSNTSEYHHQDGDTAKARKITCLSKVSPTTLLLGLKSGEVVLFQIPSIKSSLEESRTAENIRKSIEDFDKHIKREMGEGLSFSEEQEVFISGPGGTSFAIVKYFSSPVSGVEEQAAANSNMEGGFEIHPGQSEMFASIQAQNLRPSSSTCLDFVSIDKCTVLLVVADVFGFIHCELLSPEGSKRRYFRIEENLKLFDEKSAVVQLKAVCIGDRVLLYCVNGIYRFFTLEANIKEFKFELVGYTKFESSSLPLQLKINSFKLTARVYGENHWTEWKL